MKLTSKQINTGILIAIIGAVAYMIYYWIRRSIVRSQMKDEAQKEKAGQTPTVSISQDKPVFPLKFGSGYYSYGMSGSREQVKNLQRWLNSQIAMNPVYSMKALEVDGMFGELTEKALVKFTNGKIMSKEQYNALIAGNAPDQGNFGSGGGGSW